MKGIERDGKNLVSMYEAMLSCAIRQKEAAGRGDMETFEREAAQRQDLAVRIDRISPALLENRAGLGAAIEEARAVALKIAGVDAECRRLIEKARADLVQAMLHVSNERQCMAAYGSVIGFDKDGAAFVDRLK